MNITRSDYEIWFIDWFDGKLNEDQEIELLRFLKQNPDLKEEFDEFSSTRLIPSGTQFSNKEYLKRAPGDLNEKQFEYLCTAFIENDLSPEHTEELKVVISGNQDRKKTFELFRKTKLTAPVVIYSNKKSLLRKPFGERLFRFVVAGLTAAAVIFLVALYFLPESHHVPVKQQQIAKSDIGAININNPVQDKKTALKDQPAIAASDIRSGSHKKTVLPEVAREESAPVNSVTGDNPEKILASREITVVQTVPVSFKQEKRLVAKPVSNTLAANTIVIPVDYDDSQPKLSKLISKAFREKILKKKNAKDNPLKVYEIAEAGVSGLNKLFGWNMSLEEKTDRRGEPNSINFNSKILKVKTPLKNSGFSR